MTDDADRPVRQAVERGLRLALPQAEIEIGLGGFAARFPEADEIGGECDGIGLRDEVTVAHVDESGVLTGARTQRDARVAHIYVGQ